MTNQVDTGWTDAHLTRLREMRADHKSAGQIARALGDEFSRNAVIGKCRRMGLALNPRENPPRPRAMPQRRMKREFPSPQAKPAPSLISQQNPQPTPIDNFKPNLIPFSKLKDTLCKYPYGESPPYRFCGCKSVHGLSWCLEHLRIVSASAKAFEGHPQAGVRKSASREAG